MNTVTLHFKADNQQLTALDGLYKLASNTVEYVKAVFTLGENWTGFDVVRAAWYTDFECISTVLDGNGECFVPWEVLSRPEGVTINLYGCDLEEESDGEAVLVDRLTTYPVKAILVDVDARVCGSETKPVTPSQFEQYIAIVQELVGTVRDITSCVLNPDYTLTIHYSDDTSDTVGPIRGEQGEQGPIGPAGNGISKIEKVGTAGLVDTYRITYTNGQTYEYTVTNGAKGETGNGIESIYLTGTSGAVKTYTILFTDGNTFEYQVTDGEVTFATLEQLMPKDTASGDIASFPDGQAVFPLKSCVVNIEPVQAGSGTPSPDNVRPITGWTGCNLVVSPTEDAQDGTTYPITWQTEAGTVYGGTVDLVTGVLTVDMAGVDLGAVDYAMFSSGFSRSRFRTTALETLVKKPPNNNTPVEAISSIFDLVNWATGNSTNVVGVFGVDTDGDLSVWLNDSDYSDATAFKTAMSGQKVVYKLATPTTYQLTGQQIACLLGQNNVWADCGAVAVRYIADIGLYIDKKTS